MYADRRIPTVQKDKASITENLIAKLIVNAAYKIHTQLGPGLLESVYEEVLAYELARENVAVIRQATIPIAYDDLFIEHAFKVDLIVANHVLVELKSVETILPVHCKQLLTYLRLADKQLGLLINFGAHLIKDGIHRIVNGLPD